MKTTKRRSLRIAFVLDESALEQLVKVLGRVCGKLKFEIGLSDSSSIHLEDMKQLLDFPNRAARSICSLRIMGEQETHPWEGLRAQVNLDPSNDFSGAVNYEVEGEDDKQVLGVAEELEGVFESIGQSYSILAYSSPTTYGIAGVCWATGTALAVISIIMSHKHEHPHLASAFAILGDLLIFGVLFAKWIRKKFFPAGLFALGDEKKRYQSVLTRRRLLFGAIGLTLLMSFFGSLLVTLLVR
jgi:hypothetical protein